MELKINTSRILFVLLCVSICVQLSSAAAIQARNKSLSRREQLAERLLNVIQKKVLSERTIECPLGSVYDEGSGLCIEVILTPGLNFVFDNPGLHDDDQNQNGK